jgi:hypothetical protein
LLSNLRVRSTIYVEDTKMASSGKRKTTMAKLMRESRLRERRLDKQAKKEARKLAPANDPDQSGDAPGGESAHTDGGAPAPDTAIQAAGEA